MNQTLKWLRYMVLGSVAMGVVGFVDLREAKATPNVTLQRRYREQEWRRIHPDWNGRYYWHNNSYYYDRRYSYPAAINNDWATIGGGVVINNDPYLTFSGDYGSYYPTASLNIDLGSTDRYRHARALYFQHPYFWRDGVRYDRTTVTRNGTRYYRFSRHRY